ncbi:hypothetical protein DL98DRAFT_512228 [Cadophora sp. DSE1049]|nr:hypothetical protein DL98DRAFT_512228 [Cadophora sp. DSE1049]
MLDETDPVELSPSPKAESPPSRESLSLSCGGCTTGTSVAGGAATGNTASVVGSGAGSSVWTGLGLVATGAVGTRSAIVQRAGVSETQTNI